MISTAGDKVEPSVLLCFQVHQPRRLRAIDVSDSDEPMYFDDDLNKSILQRTARECYLPNNIWLLKLIEEDPRIRITFSLSGIVLEQFESYAPEVLDSFRLLAKSGSVEFVSETYYHSLAGLVKGEEFEVQTLQHAEKIYGCFGVRPVVFKNTGLIYDVEIGRRVAMLGFQGILANGTSDFLRAAPSRNLYSHPEYPHLKIFQVNDGVAGEAGSVSGSDIGSAQNRHWRDALANEGHLINFYMAYEKFGVDKTPGIFPLGSLKGLLNYISINNRLSMVKPSEALAIYGAQPAFSAGSNNMDKDLSPWLGTDAQKDAFNSLMKLERSVRSTGDEELLKTWRYLQMSDHFSDMSEKTARDGSSRALDNYMNVLKHFKSRVNKSEAGNVHDHNDLSSIEAERQNVRSTTPVWVMNLGSVSNGRIP